MSASYAYLCRSLRLRLSSAAVASGGPRRPSSFSSLAHSSLQRHSSSPPRPPKRCQQYLLSSHHPLRFASSKSRASSARPKKSGNISPDEELGRLIDLEYKRSVDIGQSFSAKEVDKPKKFYFEIIDNTGDRVVILKRAYAQEIIQATVFLDFFGGNDPGEEDEDEGIMGVSISLVVTIDKGEGPLLEFNCHLNIEELEIESMILKNRDDLNVRYAYQGPEFSALNENLQKGLYKYLKERGIQHSLFDFLYECMINKEEKEFLRWLKNIRQIIQK